jgi:hypothetical protein
MPTLTPKPKRRWYQFSQRTLLVLVLLVSIGLSWLGIKMNQARRQREVVKAILEAGGAVYYDYEYKQSGNPEPPAPAWLRKLFGDDLFRDVVT